MASFVDYNRDAEHDIINETPDYISQLSDGSNVYTIKDTTAREGLSSKQDILTPGTGIDITNGVISTTVNNLSGVQSSISGDTVTFGVKQSEIGSTPGSLYINSGSANMLSGDITLRAGFNHPGNVNIIAAGSLDGGLRLKTAYNKLTLDKASSAGEIGGNVTFGTNVLTVSDSVFTYKGDAVALAKNIPSSVIVDQTYDGTSTNAQSGVAIESQLDKKLDLLDFSLIVPDTSKMTVLKTIDFDIAATTSYKFCYFVNNMSNLWDIKGESIFRMTVTGTNINQNIEGIISMRQGFEAPYVVIRNRRGNATAATSGIRYIYARYPKAFENGYNWEFEFAAYDATARHVKIEILKSDTGFNWIETLTATTYNSTYQGSGSLTAYTTDGIIGIPNLYWNASSATSSQYVSSHLPKIIGGTQPVAGAALLANQFVYMYNNKVYPATNKTNAIEPGFGIVFNSTAVSSGSAETYTYMRQKVSATNLGNIPHTTLAKGNPCYFRCTMDSNGNIKSDNYVATSMAAGYTWYYVGIAQSSSAINIDTTQSFFLTLDSSGNLTHINGKKIGGAGTITVDQTYDGTSTNAQSGVAINSVLGDIETLINAL